MPSVILRTAIRVIIPGLLIFSLFLLFRGHNEPGGGFVGGLVAAAAITLYTLAWGVKKGEEMFRVQPQKVIATGLLVAFHAGLPGWFTGGEFMQGVWPGLVLPVLGKVGTPVIFDIGVYLLVTGMVVKVIFTLAAEEEA